MGVPEWSKENCVGDEPLKWHGIKIKYHQLLHRQHSPSLSLLVLASKKKKTTTNRYNHLKLALFSGSATKMDTFLKGIVQTSLAEVLIYCDFPSPSVPALKVAIH